MDSKTLFFLTFLWHKAFFITDLFLPPAADVGHHKGNALPRPVVWSKENPGKHKPRWSRHFQCSPSTNQRGAAMSRPTPVTLLTCASVTNFSCSVIFQLVCQSDVLCLLWSVLSNMYSSSGFYTTETEAVYESDFAKIPFVSTLLSLLHIWTCNQEIVWISLRIV